MRSGVRGFTLIELLIVLAIIGTIAAIVFGRGGPSISDGDRVGQITKLSYKGVVWKTWEGEMIPGERGTVAQDLWRFSVKKEDAQVIEDLKSALSSGERVKLTYHQNLFIVPWKGGTTYFVVKVSLLE